MIRTRRLAALACTLGLLTACGSTVSSTQQAQIAANGSGDSLGLTTDVDGGGAADSGGTTTDVPTTGGATSGSGSDGATTAPVSGGATSAPTAGPSATTPAGATDTRPVKVGVVYLKGVATVASAIGIEGLDPGDTVAQAKIAFNYINAHGGLAGRKVTVISYGIQSSTDAGAADSNQLAACAAMTQDAKVDFVLTIVNARPVMLECFAKAGVPILDDQAPFGTPTAFQWPYLIQPGAIENSRLAPVLVDALWRQTWLTSKSKVGLYSSDTPEARAIVNGPLKAALARHGLTAAKVIFTTDGAALSQSSSHAVQFKAAGVDRIIPIVFSPLFLMNGANSQGYYPKYALTSTFGPGALLEGTAPKRQLQGAAGLGWQSFLDINKGKRPASNDSTKLCLKLMADNDQGSNGAVTQGFQLNVCTPAFYLQAAANAVGSVSAGMFKAAGQKLGASFVPGDTFATDMSERNDGVSKYYDLKFLDSCSCFQYDGPLHPTN